MKKILSFVLLGVLCFILVGCGKDSDSGSSPGKINIIPVNKTITHNALSMDFTVLNYATNFLDKSQDMTNSFQNDDDDLIAIEVEIDTKGKESSGERIPFNAYIGPLQVQSNGRTDSYNERRGKCDTELCSININDGLAPGLPSNYNHLTGTVDENGKVKAWVTYKIKKGYKGPINLTVCVPNYGCSGSNKQEIIIR